VDGTDGKVREELAVAAGAQDCGLQPERNAAEQLASRTTVGGELTGGGRTASRTRQATRYAVCVGVLTLLSVLAAGCELLGRRPAAAPDPTTQPAPTLAPPVATATPEPVPPTPTAAPIPLELRHEIEDAYVHFWRVRADAVLQLDPSRLPEVTAGDALQREQAWIAQLRGEGRTSRIIVDLRFRVVRATETTATVQDDVQDRSYDVDAKTKAPLGPIPQQAEVLKASFDLEKIDGVWKVVGGEQYTS
jgi:hypothetical protein